MTRPCTTMSATNDGDPPCDDGPRPGAQVGPHHPPQHRDGARGEPQPQAAMSRRARVERRYLTTSQLASCAIRRGSVHAA